MSTDATPRRRTGGRSARVREAILRAAMDVLVRRGYDDLGIAEVAGLAGVAETTVYRRWPTKAELVAATLIELAAEENPVPDTGSLAGDLHALLEQILVLLRRPEIQRVARTTAALDSGGDADAARAAFFGDRLERCAVIGRRAIARGEVRADTDPAELVEFLVAPAYLRVLLTGRPLDRRFCDASVLRTVAAFR